MKTITIDTKCPCCKEDLKVNVNLFTASVEISMAAKPASFGEKMRVVHHYKQLKGLDEVTTWDGSYRPRALKAVGKILHLFRKLENPAAIAIELLNDMDRLADKQQWAGWNLDTCHTRAGEWLADKQKPVRRRRGR